MCVVMYMYTVLVKIPPIIAHHQFFERGQFGDVKRAKWNGKVVAVKCFSSPDRKGGFSEEVRIKVLNSIGISIERAITYMCGF